MLDTVISSETDYIYMYIIVDVDSNLLFKHVSSKERLLLRRHIFRATFSASRNFNFVPFEYIYMYITYMYIYIHIINELHSFRERTPRSCF